MRRPGGQHLLFAVDQVAGVEAGDFEAVAVSDGIGGTGLDTVSTENTSIVVDVINLGVTLGAADAMLGGVFRGLDINAVGGTGGGAQETGYALFQSVLVALEHVDAAKTLLELGAAERAGPIRIVLHLRRLEHFHEGNAHALGDGRNVFQNRHVHSIAEGSHQPQDWGRERDLGTAEVWFGRV